MNILKHPVVRAWYPVFIDGASGSGKTRLGVELYRAVSDNIADLNLSDLAYVCVNMNAVDKRGETNDHAIASVVTHLLRYNAKAPNNASDALGTCPTLQALFDSIFPIKDERVALFLHLDEFQKNEWATAALLVMVEEYNLNNLNRPILLVGSGLYISHERLGLRSSGERAKLEVRFLDFDRAYELVRAAAMTMREAAPSESDFSHLERTLPKKVEEALPAVRYLVEDTGGWALACVQLGIELCVASLSVKKALNKIAVVPEALKEVEEAVSERLEYLYEEDKEAAVLGLSPAGFAKLIILALSPVSVGCISAHSQLSPAFPHGLVCLTYRFVHPR